MDLVHIPLILSPRGDCTLARQTSHCSANIGVFAAVRGYPTSGGKKGATPDFKEDNLEWLEAGSEAFSLLGSGGNPLKNMQIFPDQRLRVYN